MSTPSRSSATDATGPLGASAEHRSTQSAGLDRLPGVVFVAGLGHSGSTLLSLMLSAHEGVIGLGEVHNHLRRSQADRAWRIPMPCTCGHPMAACELWGPLDDLCRDEGVPVDEKYRAVLERVRSLYGSDVLVVDSSKNLRALAVVASVTQDIRVVHLVRDVRSWTISSLDRSTRRGERRLRDLVRSKGVRGLSHRARFTAWSRFGLWAAENDRFVDELPAFGFPVTRLGYEVLATAPRWALEQLCPALGLDYEDSMLVPAAATSHQVGGNQMRVSADKTREVMYSTRWLTRSEWLVPSLVRAAVMRRNAELVYGSIETPPVDRYDERPRPDPERSVPPGDAGSSQGLGIP